MLNVSLSGNSYWLILSYWSGIKFLQTLTSQRKHTNGKHEDGGQNRISCQNVKNFDNRPAGTEVRLRIQVDYNPCCSPPDVSHLLIESDGGFIRRQSCGSDYANFSVCHDKNVVIEYLYCIGLPVCLAERAEAAKARKRLPTSRIMGKGSSTFRRCFCLMLHNIKRPVSLFINVGTLGTRWQHSAARAWLERV